MKGRGQFGDAGGDFGQGHLAALGEGVGRVAIRAAQIARRQPDKNAGQPRKSAFPLQAQINFVDGQHYGNNLNSFVGCEWLQFSPERESPLASRTTEWFPAQRPHVLPSL